MIFIMRRARFLPRVRQDLSALNPIEVLSVVDVEISLEGASTRSCEWSAWLVKMPIFPSSILKGVLEALLIRTSFHACSL